MITVHYGRNFCFLTGAVAVLALADPGPSLGPVLSSGMYGAVHAALLVMCLRESAPLFKKLTFVALASSMAMSSVVLALGLSRFAARAAFVAKPLLLLALVSGVGAAIYGLLVRRWWIAELPFRAISRLALGCALATAAVFKMIPTPLAFGGLALAATWWFTFSMGLGFYDLRSRAGSNWH